MTGPKGEAERGLPLACRGSSLPLQGSSVLSNVPGAGLWLALGRTLWKDLWLHQHLSVMVSSQGMARKCPVNTLLTIAGSRQEKAPTYLVSSAH